jgi:hypothetical protein
VRAFLMVMVHELSKGSPEVLLAERGDSFQALGLVGQDEPFRTGVEVWAPGGQKQWCYAAIPEHAPEGGGIEGIRSRMRERTPRRSPSCASVNFRAICVIQVEEEGERGRQRIHGPSFHRKRRHFKSGRKPGSWRRSRVDVSCPSVGFPPVASSAEFLHGRR